MQWLAEPGPRRPPVAPLTVTSVTQGCHDMRCPGRVMNSQATCGGTSVGTDTMRIDPSGATKTRPRASSVLPAALEVVHPDPHLADPIVGLGVLAHAERGGVEVGGVDARLADQGVGVDAQLLDDLVLQQPVHHDHVRPDELLLACHPVEDGASVVDDELEVEIGDAAARVALAGRCLADVAAAPAEPEIAALDRVEEHRPVDRLGGHEHEAPRHPRAWPAGNRAGGP